jgi:hypothetical protein
MNFDSGWAAVIMTALIAIISGIGKLIHMVYRMEQEITGTSATLKDHGRRLDSLEAEVKNVLQLILRGNQ